jgi:hypothetical protein
MSHVIMSAEARNSKVQAIENPVRIVLQNHTSFRAGIVDVMDEGEALQIIRLPSMRREVLRFGLNFGDIDTVVPLLVQIIATPDVESTLEIRHLTRDARDARDIRDKQFSAFKSSQKKFLAEQKRLAKELNRKIDLLGKKTKREVMKAKIPPRVETRVFDPLEFDYIGTRGTRGSCGTRGSRGIIGTLGSVRTKIEA